MVNNFGRQLIDIVEETNLVILNGRTLGDLCGCKTCHKYNGSSTVDYIIVSLDIWSKVLTFKIPDQVWYTDHCPMSVLIQIKSPMWKIMSAEKLNHHTNYLWKENSAEKVKSILQDPDIIKQLNNIQHITDTDICTEKLTEVLTKTASKVLIKKVAGSHDQKYEKDVASNIRFETTKREFKKAKRQFNNNPLNVNRRLEFINKRKRRKS